MTTVHSYSVGNGDMFSIRHNSDSFTIIDCCVTDDNRENIYDLLRRQRVGKNIPRFISTHPDEDHLRGLEDLDATYPITNFYCGQNNATKNDESDDFKYYCSLRDSEKAYYYHAGCSRRWLNEGDQERDAAGLHFLWPDIENEEYKQALENAAQGQSPNNISPIITYWTYDRACFGWFGDLETEFMDKITDQIDWPKIDIIFAPHHGRDSGKIPESILDEIDPQIVVIGEAPSGNLNYYANYNTITQNSAGDIGFHVINNGIDIYSGSESYSVNFLSTRTATKYVHYIGSLLF